MSIFIAPIQPTVPQADLVFAMVLLSLLILKVVTLQHSSPTLKRLNRYVTVSLYPMSIIFASFIFQWAMIK